MSASNIITCFVKIFIVCGFFLFFARVSMAEGIPMQIDGENYVMMKLPASESSEHLWGKYINENTVLQEGIHLFPNGKFVGTWKCDLCLEVSVGSGEFRYAGEQLVLRYVSGKRRLLLIPNIAMYGYPVERKDREINYTVILMDAKNYELAVKNAGTFEFYRKINSYHQWEKILKKLNQRPLPANARFQFFGQPVGVPQ